VYVSTEMNLAMRRSKDASRPAIRVEVRVSVRVRGRLVPSKQLRMKVLSWPYHM